MKPGQPKLRFEISGYYFIGLIALVVLGFWPSYFAKFFNGTADFNFYFHFHASMVILWIAMLITQPLLIRKKKLALHRLIGKLSYVVFPLIFISVILLVHSRHNIDQEDLDIRLFVPFKDLIILATAYYIAIRYRHDINLHARGMVATGIVFIEPALVRFIMNTFGTSLAAYLCTIGIIYALLVVLMIAERHQKRGRWVFPLILVLYILVHSVIIFNVHIGIWEAFCKWFIVLPLT
ncbi:hypothetical protein [Ferruginibacter profundus]